MVTRLSHRYEVIDELGRGSDAVVYRVLDLLDDGAERALKLSARPATEADLQQLGREFAVLTRLHHAQIAAVHDFGVLHDARLTDGEVRAYYTRNLVEGQPIRAARSAAELSRWAEALLRVLGFLHAQQILHRDLKPDNILLPTTPSDRAPMLIDFGLSGLQRPAGTVAYAAPELLQGDAATVATDLYGLGATLLELASGAPPVDPGRPATAVDAILTGGVQARARGLSRVPAELKDLIAALLDPDPTRRPSSARDALAQLTGTAEALPDLGESTEAPLFGRQAVLQRLLPVSEAPPVGRYVTLVGEAGMGKTRLLTELRWQLQLARRRVVQISCRTGEGRGAVDNFVEAARWLAPVGKPPTESPSSQQALLEGLWQQLAGAAEPEGLWLLVDDAQEADSDGRAWLRFLARGTPDAALQTVVATRSTEAAPRPDGEHVVLEPLDTPAAAELLAHLTGALPDRVVEAALTTAGGNPALLRSLALHLRKQGPSVAEADGLAEADLPPSLLEAERRRITDRIGQAPWPLLTRLAVVAEPVTPDLLVDDARERRRLERLKELGLVACRERGCGPLEPLTRDAALSTLDAQDVQTLHADWLERLRGAGAAPARMAHHRVHAGHDRQGLPEVLATARELRARGATGRAAQYAAWCVETAREAGASHDVLAKHIRELAELLLESGRFDEAAERLDAVALETLPHRLAADCRLTRAAIAEKQGRLEAAEAALEPLLEATRLTRSQAAALALHRARLAVRRGRHADALHLARDGAEQAPEDGERSSLLNVAAVAQTYLGDPAAARAHLAEAVSLAQRAGDARAEAVALSQLGLVSHSEGNLAEAQQHYRRSLQRAESAGLQADLPGFTLNLATVEQEQGRLGEALGLYRRAAALSRRLGRDATLANALANYGNLMMELGAHAEAERALDDAARRAAAVGLPLVEAMTGFYRAELDWRRGQLDEALAGCTRAAEAFEELEVTLRRHQAQLTAAEVALDADRDGDADQWLTRARQARTTDAEQLAGRLQLVTGRLAARDPAQRAAAEASFEGAAGWATEHGDRSLAAAAAFQRARLRLSTGDTDGARADLERAESVQQEVAREVPAELRAQYWADPRRAAVATLSEQLAAGATAALGAAAGASSVASPLVASSLLRILRFNRELLAERDTPRLLERVMDTAVELTGAERGFLLLRGPEGKLAVEVARNIDRETIRRGGMTFSRSLAQEVAETGSPILTVSAQDDARLQLYASVSELRLKSVLGVPIRTSDRILGTLYLDNRFVRGRFSEQDVELLQAFADQVAVVLENARLTDELRAGRAALEQARAELERLNRQQAAELAEAREALAHARRDLKHEYPDIIGRSPAMRRVLELVDRVVDHDVPVLIGGESGTGKELLARTLHSHGPRAARAFVAINCGALPETLLESELFGHVRGAFTGADKDHDGLFRVADGGTLLLDEVGEMSPAMQAKLLRVLQEREIRPVGANRDLAVDVRILAATNRDLAELVAQGGFRQDLFYRLNVIGVVLPPLRERLEDLPALADFFASRATERLGLPPKRLTKAALRRLLDHRWPGNVRELENVIANALLMADGDTVGPGDLTLRTAAAPSARRGRRLADLEREAVEAALRETGGNRTRAAALLGISRVTLQRRLKKWRDEG